jgi:hypothetical protein
VLDGEPDPVVAMPRPVNPPVGAMALPLRVHSRLNGSGGPRALSGISLCCCGGPVRSRCARIFAITSGSSILAMIFSLPPQRTLLSMSMPKARSRLKQLLRWTFA